MLWLDEITHGEKFMKKINLLLLFLCELILSACSQSPFNKPNEMEPLRSQAAINNSTSVTNTSDSSYTTAGAQYHLALLTGEQMLKSFIALTDISDTNLNNITSEYNARKGVQSIENDLNFVTAPMLLATTNLAGEACLNLITKEKSISMTQRKFFKDINFNSTVNTITDTSWMSTYKIFSNIFWGRNPTDQELSIFQTMLSEFRAGLAANENTATMSSNLAHITCTATLASIEVLSF